MQIRAAPSNVKLNQADPRPMQRRADENIWPRSRDNRIVPDVITRDRRTETADDKRHATNLATQPGGRAIGERNFAEELVLSAAIHGHVQRTRRLIISGPPRQSSVLKDE